MTGDAVEFIVLTTTKVGENALVVHTLSREWGRRGFLVRSAKKTGTTVDALCEKNNITRRTILRIGRRLVL